MKKRLRFELPRTPLKVLRGDQDEEDLQDKYYKRFVQPSTTTTATEDGNITTDIGEVSEDSVGRYMGRHTSSIGSISQANGILEEVGGGVHPNYKINTGNQTVSSNSHEAIEMQVLKQVQLPHQSGDIDDDGPLTDDTTSYVSNALSTDDAASYVSNALSTDDAMSNVSNDGS